MFYKTVTKDSSVRYNTTKSLFRLKKSSFLNQIPSHWKIEKEIEMVDSSI